MRQKPITNITTTTIDSLTWMADGACTHADVDPDIFFANHGGDNDKTTQALNICETCPVRTQCLDYALTFKWAKLPGVWGGTTQRQRRLILRHGMARPDA